MEILRNNETENLMKDKHAFLMLLKIAYFAKTDESFTIPNLNYGEAFITPALIGLSVQSFRTAKTKLSKWGFATFRTTNRGTFAKLTTDKFFRL